jgi:hypothetical protein
MLRYLEASILYGEEALDGCLESVVARSFLEVMILKK